MRTQQLVIASLLACVLCVLAHGQTAAPQNIYGAGISWNQSASSEVSQQFAGTALYAREQTTAGTYAFTVLDAVPTTYTPFTINTNFGVGVGQRVFTAGGWTGYGTAAAGPSWSGSNSGWNWSGGAIATHPLKDNWWVGINARVVKSSVNNNSGTQFILGVLFGLKQ